MNNTTVALRDEAAAALQAVKAFDPNHGAVLEKYISGMASFNIVTLGEDQAFALRDASGDIKCFKQRLTLSDKNGGLVQPVFNGPFVISAQGYEMWAEASGTCVVFPKTVVVDGVPQANPHVVRDEKSRRILNIYSRAVAFRFSSKGLPMVADWTTTFDVPSYRLIDLVAKAKKFPQAFKLLPSDMGKPESPGTWGAYPFDETMTLWVNSTHEEAIKWYGEILNREKKALDFSQTFARRNACKHLSGLQKAPGSTWTMAVLCWRPMNGALTKWDSSVYANVQQRVEGLTEGQGFALPEGSSTANQTLTVSHGVEHIEDEPEAVNVEADPEDQQTAEQHAMAPEPSSERTIDAEFTGKREPPAPAPERQASPASGPELSAEDRKDMDQLRVARKEFPGEFHQAMERLGIPENSRLTPNDARVIIAEINRILDQGA